MQPFGLQGQTNVTEADMSYESFGALISPEEAKDVSEITKNLLSMDSTTAKVTGVVAEVCQVKGCWMTVNDRDMPSDPLFVKFKDYGFFVPKDLAGKNVIMEGTAYREVTSVDELRHYAKDAGKSKAEIEAILEPKEELRFLAHGVLVKK